MSCARRTRLIVKANSPSPVEHEFFNATRHRVIILRNVVVNGRIRRNKRYDQVSTLYTVRDTYYVAA